MFRRHAIRWLSAYRDGELGPEKARSVSDHLERCPLCRAAFEEVAFGSRLAEKLPLVEAPDSLWLEVERGLARRPREAGRARRWPRVAAALTAVAIVAGAAWYAFLRQPLHVVRAAGDPSDFERATVEEHTRLVSGREAWELRTSGIGELRSWVKAASAMTADEIPIERPAEDARRLRIVGAKLARVGGATAAVIGYEMDSEAVTLATARLKDLHDPPPVGRFSKDIAYRFDALRGVHVLTWGVGHQAYVMVSRLPNHGQAGCFLCHTTRERRELIARSKLEPGT